jgi:putative Ig domain-containing protein/FG-GAP repeat protein
MPQLSQQGPKLVATDASGAAQQGASVVLSADGSTAIVGGPGDSNQRGAAWVYTRSGLVWTQGPKLLGTDASSRFGSSVSLSADGTAIVGGPGDNNGVGAAWVSVLSGTVWTSQGQLSAPDASGAAQQGSAVSISSGGITTIAMVGAPANNGEQGAAWVYRRTMGLSWMEGPELVGSDVSGAAQQGVSVALSADGSAAIVGGPGDSGGQGAAWVYKRGSGGGGGGGGLSWTPLGKLSATNVSGAAQQGSSVALSSDGSTVIVGGPSDNNGLGAAWVFTLSGSGWTQQGKLVGTDASGAAQQGASVALSADGNTAIVGGPGDTNGLGAAWVYTRSGGTWAQQGTKLSGSDVSGAAQQGSSVSLSADGNTAIVGGLGDSAGAGAAWVYATTPTAPPLVMVGPLPPATVGLPYSQTLTASGGTPPYVWSVVSGALPNGIALSPGTGVLSGTPTAAGTFNFAVGLSDSTTPTSLTTTRALTLTVISAPGGPLTITSPLPPATTGLAYSQTLTASGGTPPYVWSVVSGAPPSGITLSSAGLLSGTPTQSGTAIFTVTATDSTATGAQTATGTFGLTVE